MSVYVAGGGGTHLEPRVTSYYLAALISAAAARGVLGTVSAVKTQQSEMGSPLDDLVIDGVLADGTATRLDLQITTTLSFTEGDEKWRDIVPRAWSTFRQSSFTPTTRRLGIAVSQTTTKLERSIQPLLARARHAVDPAQYRQRLAKKGGANDDQREFQRVLDVLVKQADPTATDDEIVELLRCLTIIPFDLDQELASRDRLAAVDRLIPASGDAAEAQKVWSSLNAIASRIIPSGGGVDRATVARALQVEGYVVGSDRRQAAMVTALDVESRAAVASIRSAIGGFSVQRDAVYAFLLDGLDGSRLLRIVGEHGTGKSALLKRLALEEPAGAPILFLRDLRVKGGGWAIHSAQFGAPTPLVTLLREIGLGGSRTLFIDGVDKMVDPAVHVTVNDLLATIATAPGLEEWRVVMTMREENILRVQGWLDPDAVSALPSATVRVEGFDEDEATEAAAGLPLLRALLLDPQNYDKVLRRPFFLEALSRLPRPSEGEVKSEVDLVGLWWQNGGADGSDFAPAQGRRNILLTLGERLLSKPAVPFMIRDLDPVPLDELRRTGVLRDVAFGSTVAFAHDIYEEWSLHRVLSERKSDIAQALLDGGQDLQLARPIQLLATDILERVDGTQWMALLSAVEGEDLRLLWSRVVLTSPVRSVRSAALLNRIEAELMRDDGKLLGRLMLSVRTTETVRNLRFLDERLIPDLTREQREQYASEAASPQLLIWKRLMDWIAPRLQKIPPRQSGELYSLLDAWVGSVPSVMGKYLHLPAIAGWARCRLGDEDTKEESDRLSSRPDAEKARALLLRCSGSAPDVVRDYLSNISSRELKHLRKEIVRESAPIIELLPAELSAFVKRAFLLDHNRKRRYHAIGEMAEALGFDDDRAFYPPSPARLPFLQLLRSHSDEGLSLVRDVCNHAMVGWRRSRTRPGQTPLPVTVDLGDGPQAFWGDSNSYGWFRGGSSVDLLDTALMALEAWAHEQQKAGAGLDDLCRRIALQNHCNAVLGICAGLLLAETAQPFSSEVALVIGTHPALLSWDLHRSASDRGTHINEMGSWTGNQHLARALRTHNELPHRKRTVRDLSVWFAALAQPKVSEKYASLIATFLDRVPYETEEQRDDRGQADSVRKQFEQLRQQVDPANLKTEERDGKTLFWIEPPYTAEQQHKEFLAEHTALERVLRLYLWATKALEIGRLEVSLTLQQAFDEMIALDEPELFDVGETQQNMRRHYTQSAVSGAAAVIAGHADYELWEHVAGPVADVLARASAMPEVDDKFSSRETHLTGHPPAMAAYGYAALVRRNPFDADHRASLFQLAVDPMEKVVEAVYSSAAIFAVAAPDMVWRLYCLASQRAAHTHVCEHGLYWSYQEAAEQLALAENAERLVLEDLLPQPAPSMAAAAPVGQTYRWDYQRHVFALPIKPLLGSTTTHAKLLDDAGALINAALASLAQNGRRSDVPFTWLHKFGGWLGRLLGHLTLVEVRDLLLTRLNRARYEAAAELMDDAIQRFMIDYMLDKTPLDARIVEIWEALVDWILGGPSWTVLPPKSTVSQHDRGMALSALFCAISDEIVCGIEPDWPNTERLLPAVERAAGTFAYERTVFAALLKLVAAKRNLLLPRPALGWLSSVVSIRRSAKDFWEHASNGEQLVVLLRDLIAEKALAVNDRATIIEIADALIEVGVRGAAFLQQDMVRLKR